MPGVPFQSLVEPGGFEMEYGTPPPFIIAPYAATTNVDARTRSLKFFAIGSQIPLSVLQYYKGPWEVSPPKCGLVGWQGESGSQDSPEVGIRGADLCRARRIPA